MSAETIIRGYDPSRDYSDVHYNLNEAGLFDPDRDTATLLQTYASSVLVAETDGTVVGNVYASEGIMPIIFHLAVRESHRGHGIGSLLLRAAEDQLKRQGHPDAELFVDVTGKNYEALIRFYADRGYRNGDTYKSMWRILP